MSSALVLAAGLGTRLDPLTRLVAKPAVPVAGHALGERVLRWLAREGVTDVVLNLHHLPHTITDLIGDGTSLIGDSASRGMRVRYSWEREILGSAGGPRHALSLMNSDPFLIVNGDTLTDMTLAPMIAAHTASGAEVTMAVIPNPAKDHYNGIVAGDDNVVRGFIPKGHTDASWHFVGIQVVNKHVFAALPDNTPAETVRGLYRDMVATSPGRVRVYPVTAPFHDVGTAADYRKMCTDFGGADVHGNIIWPSATVADTAQLSNCIVAGDVNVPSNLIAADSILISASAARAGDSCTIVGDIAKFKI